MNVEAQIKDSNSGLCCGEIKGIYFQGVYAGIDLSELNLTKYNFNSTTSI